MRIISAVCYKYVLQLNHYVRDKLFGSIHFLLAPSTNQELFNMGRAYYWQQTVLEIPNAVTVATSIKLKKQ